MALWIKPDKQKVKKIRGTPSKLTPENIARVTELAEQGKTEREICKAIPISLATMCAWKQKNPEFKAILNKAKLIPDEQVERSLFERAMGYSHPAVKIHVLRDGKVVKVDYTEHYPPDTGACIFWLKNRRPDRWKDKHEISVSKIEEIFKALDDGH